MATSYIPIELRTASDLKSMKLFSADAIKRIIKQQQGIQRFDYDFLAGLPGKPKQKNSAEEWRREAQDGRFVDLETALEPGDMSRFPDPSSTPKQVTLDTILTEIRSIRDDLVTINERLDKHDKDITQLMQTQHRDTDEYVDPDMFGASARPKSNPAPRIKTSGKFEENSDVYDDQMFGFGRYVPQHYQGPQIDDTSDHMQYPPTNRAERNTWQPRYTSPYRTQTSTRGNHQGLDETRRIVADIQSRYVNLDNFDGKVGEWDNWYHQFEFLANHYNWDDRERLVRLVSCLKGHALTAYRIFSQTARNTYAHCIAAFQERYGLYGYVIWLGQIRLWRKPAGATIFVTVYDAKSALGFVNNLRQKACLGVAPLNRRQFIKTSWQQCLRILTFTYF